MNQEEIIERRKENIKKFLKGKNVWVFGFIVLALILGIYIRSMPMQDHGGNPGLWDVTTNTWTLGPDLDPWLFLRYAKVMVEEGSLYQNDTLRFSPFGFDTSHETKLLPYLIAVTYKVLHLFNEDVNVEYAGVIFPVIMFVLTIIVFFLFVKELFNKPGGETKANLIALISTFFMIVIPVFLSRTIAGIPEKESAAFFFMFLGLYFFIKGIKTIDIKNNILFGVLAGISTGLMGLIWGGVLYLFIPIALTNLVAFAINKIKKKEIIVYSSWIFVSLFILSVFSNRTSFISLLTSLSSGLAVLVEILFIVHLGIWNTKLSDFKIPGKDKLPKNILSGIIALIVVLVLVIVFFGPSFILDKLKAIHQTLFKPIIGRWNTTVAENRQPFFTEWSGSFGPFIAGIPIFFWSFILGSVVLFKKMLNKIQRKDSIILTSTYIFFLFGLIFSRYSGAGLFNGENFISKAFYYISAIIFIGSLAYYIYKDYEEGASNFKRIPYNYILLLMLFVFTLFTVRGAVRLIMVLGPIASILVSYLVVETIYKFKKMPSENTNKMFMGILVALLLIGCIFTFSSFYKTSKNQAYNMVPSYYNQQWQKAMSWVRNETPADSVFAHWWDYGYWVQSIGDRATVSDGGNFIVYWNYLMGRHVLTGDNQKDSLEFLYAHDANYLLIDSSDIGKYTAFSSIGSDENFDRFGWIPTFTSDPNEISETKNGVMRIYRGGSTIDEDISYNLNGTEIFLPSGRAGLAGILIETEENGKGIISFKQPEGVFVYNGQQIKIPLRYIDFEGQFNDFGNGLDATVKIVQNVYQKNTGLELDVQGAVIFISPRLMKGYFAQKYLLNDPFSNFPNFKIAHIENNVIIDGLNAQGANLNEFVYYSGLGIIGPIKIWEIAYTGKEELREEFLDRDSSKYLDWRL
jgi:asparagine N-glycosylation enzyme membrane subunit Stt3